MEGKPLRSAALRSASKTQSTNSGAHSREAAEGVTVCFTCKRSGKRAWERNTAKGKKSALWIFCLSSCWLSGRVRRNSGWELIGRSGWRQMAEDSSKPGQGENSPQGSLLLVYSSVCRQLNEQRHTQKAPAMSESKKKQTEPSPSAWCGFQRQKTSSTERVGLGSSWHRNL